MKTFLCVDMSNLLYRVFSIEQESTDAVTLAGLSSHRAFMTLHKYFKKFKPDKMVLVFDRKSWRKYYTEDPELCYSGKIYKGHRRQNFTEAQKERYAKFVNHIEEFEKLVKDYSSMVCLSADLLEADDIVGGLAEKYHKDHNIFILSADKDFIQLLRYDNVKLINPDKDEERTLEEWDNDADYFMFEKKFRGDIGDSVQSAYPRLRSTKIKQAYTDSYLLTNLLNETWTNQDKKEFIVGKLFEENELLMDLRKQPPEIRELIFSTIEDGFNNTGKYSHFHILKYLGKNQMNKLAESISQFVTMLNS